MTFDDYQQQALRTAIYPGRGANFSYPALGLAGETGEVSELVKKLYRDDEGRLTPERKALLAKELGDVLWYVAALADECGLKLDDIAEANINKLASRFERGVLHGDGDNR